MRVWFNGRIADSELATVSALDPAVQYGLGVFEVLRAYGGEPFLLARHLARMRASAKRFDVKIRFSDAGITRGARSLLKALRLESANVRLVQTGGGAFLIRAVPLEPLPAPWFRRGAAVDFAPWRRDIRAPLHGHKSLNYLENVLTRGRAHEAGLADYLFLSTDGLVLEGCVTNVFLVMKGRLVTPRLHGILPGVTRNEVIRLAKRAKVRVDERDMRPGDFAKADEAFLTNALIEILPLARVGKVRLRAPGPVTNALAVAYRFASTTS